MILPTQLFKYKMCGFVANNMPSNGITPGGSKTSANMIVA